MEERETSEAKGGGSVCESWKRNIRKPECPEFICGIKPEMSESFEEHVKKQMLGYLLKFPDTDMGKYQIRRGDLITEV